MSTENSSISKQSQIEDEPFWKNHYEQMKSGGVSRARYCRDNQLNYDRFGYWINKWSTSGTNFVAVKIKEQLNEAPTVLCTMTLRSGFEIKIHDISVLSFVLERLA